MGDERPPPPITLTDPNHPGPLHDVLGTDVPPWRPSRRQLTIALVVVLVVVTAVTPYLVVREGDLREQRLVAASTVTLLDASDGDLGRTTTPPDFTLANGSREPLRLLTAALDDYPAVRLDRVLAAGDTTVVKVPLPRACPGVAPVDRPGVMAVTYEVRGHRKTQLLDVHGTTAAYAFRAALQARCLLYSVQEAVTGHVYLTTRRGTELALRVELENVSPEATSLLGIEFVDGFRVARTSPRLPLPLPAARSFDLTGRLALGVDIAVDDCAAARQFQASYTTGFLPAMTARVSDGTSTYRVELEHAGPPVFDDVRELVEAACGPPAR